MALFRRCFSSLSPSALSPQLVVRNAAAGGRLALPLPLPGRPGLTRVALGGANETVGDALAAVRAADATLKAVELTTPEGTRVARSVALAELAAMRFCLRLDRVSVLVETGAFVNVARGGGGEG